jgi:uncharacterized protein (DUF58 family)
MTGRASPQRTGAGGAGVAASLEELVALRNRMPGLSRRPPFPRAAAPGNHPSTRFSRGMEFAEARPYQPGDDVRTVDWRQTARRGKLYTKLFQEELERPVCLLADLGLSMRFGTRGAFKSVQAARAAAWLAWSAVAAGDRVGGVIWNGQSHREVRPQGRHHGALALLRHLAEATASDGGEGPDLSQPLKALGRTLRPGSRTVLISDFAELGPGVESAILTLARGGELILVHVYDVFEAEGPPPGCYRLTDGRGSLALDLRSDAARAAYLAPFAARRTRLDDLARRTGASLIPLATHLDPVKELARFLP